MTVPYHPRFAFAVFTALVLGCRDALKNAPADSASVGLARCAVDSISTTGWAEFLSADSQLTIRLPPGARPIPRDSLDMWIMPDGSIAYTTHRERLAPVATDTADNSTSRARLCATVINGLRVEFRLTSSEGVAGRGHYLQAFWPARGKQQPRLIGFVGSSSDPRVLGSILRSARLRSAY